jgi:high-affinity nickel-transport protein
MLLMLSTIHSAWQALVFISIFGLGSVTGMLMVSLLLAIPLQWTARNSRSGHQIAQATAGAFSCVFGIWLGWEILGTLI